VPSLPWAAQLHATALLDDVGGLVRHGVEIGGVAQHDVVTGRDEARTAHASTGTACTAVTIP